jgi:hypothetical protein
MSTVPKDSAMETDTPVIAPAGTQTSVTVALHPLVIMNLSEQYTRVKAQTGGQPQPGESTATAAAAAAADRRELLQCTGP